MKALIRWSATLSLVGGVLLGSLVTGNTRALALTQAQVAERLRPVPVFTLTDGQGSPLVASPQEGQQGPPIAGVFISQQDAQNFLTSLRQSNPDLARNVEITPISLAEVYQLAQEGQNQSDRLEFAFVPIQQEVQTAVSLLQQSGQQVEQFQGVPLFVARSSGQNGGYLTIQQGEQQVIPMFFKRDELQAVLDRVRQQQPNLAGMTIQVVNLEGLIETLQSSDNPELNRILLIPPRESIDFIRSLPTAPANQPGAGQPSSGTPAPRSNAAPSSGAPRR